MSGKPCDVRGRWMGYLVDGWVDGGVFTMIVEETMPTQQCELTRKLCS